MNKYVKPLLGVVLIVTAIALLVYWEAAGREAVLQERALVARQDIFPGTVIDGELFREVSIPGENMIEKGMAAEDMIKIEGRIANQLILKNSQISERLFSENNRRIVEGTGVFLIKSEWIFSVSSSVRKGDVAEIYTLDGKTKLGAFSVAFAKDEGGVEVTDVEIGGNANPKKILDREVGSARVSYLEIIAPLDKYTEIIGYVFAKEGKLIILNREEE